MKKKIKGPDRELDNAKKGPRSPRSSLGSFGEILKGAPGFDELFDQMFPSKAEPPGPDMVLSPKPGELKPRSQSPAPIEKKKAARTNSKNRKPSGAKKDHKALPPLRRSVVPPSIYAPRGPVGATSDRKLSDVKPAKAQPLALRGLNALAEVKKRVLTVSPIMNDDASDTCSSQVDEMVARGSALFRANPHPATDGYLVGFDFGSSATKRVLHKPELGIHNWQAVMVPEGLRAASDPHCWQTAVWFDPESRRFSLTPKPAHEKITGFKSAIVLGRKTEIANSPTSVPVTFCEAAVAYLSMMVAHTLADYTDNMYFGRNSEPWFTAFFFGYPSTTDQKTNMERAFAPVFWAAYALVGKADYLTLDEIKTVLLSLNDCNAFKFPNVEIASPFYARSELEALIAGYRATHASSDGAHIFIDIGATTLDIAYVRFLSELGVSGTVYSSRVETLGAEALEWFRKSPPHVDDQIFLTALSFVLSDATREAKCHDRAFDRQIQAAKGAAAEPVVKVFCGGGQHSEFHQKALRHPESDIHWNAPSRSPTPALFANVEPIGEHKRLLVACGLARDHGDFPTLKRAEPVKDMSSKKIDFSDKYVGPEQM